MSKKHPFVYFVVAVVFATYTTMAAPLAYAIPKDVTVEVKAGTITGLVTDLDEKPLAGKSIQILDTAGKIKYSALTDKDGKYKITGLVCGTYTMIIAHSQKVILLVKEDSNNKIINAMLPATTKAYSAGAISTPLAVAILGGVVLIGISAYGIAEYDTEEHVSP